MSKAPLGTRDRKATPRTAPAAASHDVYVLLASFFIGGAVLVIEIAGTRVVAPYYGASVYVWSSLIGVTLASLTVGYLAGGWVADRSPVLHAFALETIGGAIALVAIPWLRSPVLVATTPLGVKAGSLSSAAVLFAPPLVLLAMTGPLAIRLVTGDFSVLGRGVGKIYGVSTLGSMLGAILTGFVLIPSFSVRTILVATAAVLLALGATGLLLSRRTAAGVVGLGAALLAAAALDRPPPRPSNVVYAGNSFHGEIKVLDAKDARVLLIDGIDNGLVDRTTMESRSPYIALFEYLPAARPAAKRALCIGLGAGSVPRSLQGRHGIATDVVEIDPEIVRVARRYFGFPSDIHVAVEDGRTFVEHAEHRYDFVVLDAFHAEAHPLHLFTREFFARADAILDAGGILAINMVGVAEGPVAAGWQAVDRTLRERFPHVRVFAAPQVDPAVRDLFTNVFVVASHEPLPPPATLGEGATFTTLAQSELPASAGGPTWVLTDDYNPLDDLQRSLMVAWREDLIGKEQSVLLYDGAP
jgi:spermidine synthase